MFQFKPVKTMRGGKVADLIAEQIRRAIVTGEVSEGDALPPEHRLIAIFGASRPSVREAISILSTENLIVTQRGASGGARVRAPSIALVARSAGLVLQGRGGSLMDVYDVRILIEPIAARLAAQAQPEGAAKALKMVVEREDRLVENWAAAEPATAEFHTTLLEQSGNTALALVGLTLKDLVQEHQTLIRKATFLREPEMRRGISVAGVKAHRRLVELIEAGLGEEAETHWRGHMLRARKFWFAGIEDSPVNVLDRL